MYQTTNIGKRNNLQAVLVPRKGRGNQTTSVNLSHTTETRQSSWHLREISSLLQGFSARVFFENRSTRQIRE